MMKLSMGWVLAGLTFVAAIPFGMAGCSRSLEGDCEAGCNAVCDEQHDCAIYAHLTVPDAAECKKNCPDTCRKSTDQIIGQCDAHNQQVELYSDVVDNCINAINQLAAGCRDNKASAVLDATKIVGDECNKSAFVCK